MASLQANGSMIGMPSRVVDDAWHEFILMTRLYHGFCNKAEHTLFGKYLHHTPNAVASKPARGAIPHTLKYLVEATKRRYPNWTGGTHGRTTSAVPGWALRIENGRRWTAEEIALLESTAAEADCLGGADTDRDNCCG